MAGGPMQVRMRRAARRAAQWSGCLLGAGLLSFSLTAVADDDKVEAAIGGGVGGAVGAVIGEELGDKEGAIIGAGVGAAVGAAIAIDEDEDKKDGVDVDVDHPHDVSVEIGVVESGHPKGRFCPPGQAKKGRC